MPSEAADTRQHLRDLIDVLSHELRQPVGLASAAVVPWPWRRN